MTIQNLTQKNDIIEFDINNKKSEYKISFCNALRRILISNIKCYGINFNEIRDFGQIQRHIGESWAEYRAMRSYVYDTARNTDLSKSGNRLDTDGVKLYATTAAKNIADRAIQVMGGYGYVGEYVVERLWRDSKLLEIGGGTLESHQKNITRDLAKMPEKINE